MTILSLRNCLAGHRDPDSNQESHNYISLIFRTLSLDLRQKKNWS
jgi:hypothetical protein